MPPPSWRTASSAWPWGRRRARWGEAAVLVGSGRRGGGAGPAGQAEDDLAEGLGLLGGQVLGLEQVQYRQESDDRFQARAARGDQRRESQAARPAHGLEDRAA